MLKRFNNFSLTVQTKFLSRKKRASSHKFMLSETGSETQQVTSGLLCWENLKNLAFFWLFYMKQNLILEN